MQGYQKTDISSFGHTGKLIVAPDISGVSKGRLIIHMVRALFRKVFEEEMLIST